MSSKFFTTLATFTLAMPIIVGANPKTPTVVAGTATFHTQGKTLTITCSNRSIVNWNSYSIAANETTKYVQPSSSAVTLSRVTTANASSILGKINANGIVYLINPNGITFGANAVINTAGFLASTLDVPNAMFLAGGNLTFTGTTQNTVLNLGSITASTGDVVLLGYRVVNQGLAKATASSVRVAAGVQLTLASTGTERITIIPSAPPPSPTGDGINNTVTGQIQAIQAEIKADGNPYALAIRHDGKIDATGTAMQNGRVVLVAINGKTAIGGTISAKNSGSCGGIVDVKGYEVDFFGKIDAEGDEIGGAVELSAPFLKFRGQVSTRDSKGGAGTLLLDPNDITISSGTTNPPPPFTGTFFDGAGVVSSVLNNGELQNALGSNNVTIATSLSTLGGNGDITFLDSVLWDSNFSLTVNASRHINIFNKVANDGSGSLILNSGGDLNVGFATSAIPCQVGSRLGPVTLNVGGDLNVIGGNTIGAFAQIGYDAATVTSNIIIPMLGGNVNVMGGTADQAYALIGHGGAAAVGGTKSGNIDFQAGDAAFLIKGGTGSAPQAFAQIGHTRGISGAVNASGDVVIGFSASNFSLQGGIGGYALFGHGGGLSDKADTYSGQIKAASNAFLIEGGSGGAPNLACFGFFAEHSGVAPVTINSTLIEAISHGPVTIHSADGALSGIVAAVIESGMGGTSVITVDSIHIETDNLGDLSMTADATAVFNAVGLGTFNNLGTAVCTNLNLNIGGNLSLTAGTGAGQSSATIGNGKDPFSGAIMTINTGGAVTLQGGSNETAIQSVDTLVLNANGGNLTLNAGLFGNSTISSSGNGTLSSSGDINLNGMVGGSNAVIYCNNGNLSISAGQNVNANPNSNIQNQGMSNGTLIIIAGQHITATDAASAGAAIENFGSGSLQLLAQQDIVMRALLQNPGTGDAVLNAGRDIVIGAATATLPSQFGLTTGTLSLIVGRDLNVLGGNTMGAFAQLGSEGASVNSNLSILTVGNNVNVMGGTASEAFASIGHGRVNGVSGTKTGNIEFGTVIGNMTLSGGNNPNTYAQVGHCHGGSNTVTASGNVSATSLVGSLHLIGGSGSFAYTLFGHGGLGTNGDSYTGNISVSANEILLTGGSAQYSMAEIGFSNGRSSMGPAMTISSNLISAVTSGALTLQAGSATHAHASIGVAVDTTAANTITVGSITADAALDLSILGSSSVSTAFAEVGIFTNTGNVGTNLTLNAGQNLNSTANQGAVFVSNGLGAPVGTFAIQSTVNGSATLQSATALASFNSIQSCTINVPNGSLTLNASATQDCAITSNNALSLTVLQNVNLNGTNGMKQAYLQNSNDALTAVITGNLVMSPNTFIRNLGGNNGNCSIDAFDLNVTGSALSNSFIHNSGAGALILTAQHDMNINASIQNPGTGLITATTGRDLNVGNGTAPLACRLEATNSALNLIANRDLNVTASPSGLASITSNSDQSYSVTNNATFTGVAGGSQAFGQANNGTLNMITIGTVTLNPNTFIRHQGGGNGDLSISAGSITTIGSSGNNAFIHNLGSGVYSLETTFGLNILSNIQNPGTGTMTAFVGGTMNVGSATNTVRSLFGSVNADVNITVIGDLNVTAGSSANAFAQIGGHANIVLSNVTINFVSGNLTLLADTALNTYAQLGHRGLTSLLGTITVGEVGGTTTVTPGPNLDTYATIGSVILPIIP